LASNHLMKLRRDWVFRYGNKYFFNPGIPSVRYHLVDMIGDVVTRYDIDGVHFDDYFYPYPEKDQSIPDNRTFSEFGSDFKTIEDWRRNNVDEFIRLTAEKIRSIKPYVKFGVSPFGVWRNSKNDPNGSDTKAGIQTYDDLFADVLLWLDKSWIDYAAPQIYWSIGFPAADYEKLTDWWSKHSYGKHIYIGHAAYKIGDPNITKNDPNWGRRDEINRQVWLNRGNQNIQGSIFFSAKAVMRNPLGVADSLTYSLFEQKALTPAFAFKSEPPAAPAFCRVKGSPSAVKLAWQICSTAPQDQPYYYAVYRFIGTSVGDFNDPSNLLYISKYNDDTRIFEDQTARTDEYYTYVVTGFNRFNVESFSSEPYILKKTRKSIRKYGGNWFTRLLKK
jgi:Glycosyl hydrolase-like 10